MAAGLKVCDGGLAGFATLARRRQWMVAEEGGAGVVTLLPPGLDRQAVGQSLVAPAAGCIEAGVEDAWDGDPGDIGVALTTRTAFTFDLGGIITEAVRQRGWLPPERAQDMTLAMHEALANALMHGNLELDSADQSTPDAFLRQAERLRERMESPAYGDRALVVLARHHGGRLEVSITDSGGGFTVDPTRPVTGRGLRLMREHCDQLLFLRGGRRAVLRFGAGGLR